MANLPAQHVPFVLPDGTVSPVWYQAISDKFSEFSGGSAPLFRISNEVINNFQTTYPATLANAPSAGNPTKWLPVQDKDASGNAVVRWIPSW